MSDLAEIPDGDLAGAFSAAIAAGNGFIPGNGLIVSTYRGIRGDRFEDAQKAIRAENNAKYLAAPSNDLPTPEQREANAAAIRALSEKLK